MLNSVTWVDRFPEDKDEIRQLSGDPSYKCPSPVVDLKD